MTELASAPGVLAALARQEVRNYLRNKVFWFGAVLWLVQCVVSVSGSSAGFSTIGDGIGPAATIGVLGLVVMAGLVRASDGAATTAGAVATPERTRTLALAAATVVPLTMGLVWFVCAVVGYQVDPPAPYAAPFPPGGEAEVYAQLFSQGVMACVGGPILGLVIGRWWPRRGVAPVAAVLVVVVTMVMQPLFDTVERVRLLWVWVHFLAPSGVEGDAERMVLHTGSPFWFICYQAALCALGVLVAVAHDPGSRGPRLRRALAVVAAIAVATFVLALMVGPDVVVPGPVPSPDARD